MLVAIIELKLVYPFKISLDTLLRFNNLWGCHLLEGGTSNNKATISMPIKQFKKIFKTNPRKAEFKVPVNAEKFLSAVKVKEVREVEKK